MYRNIIFKALRYCFLILIRTYQKCISPLLGDHCRFYPSCSQYAHDAMTLHSIPKALYLTVRRLLRCHPFNPGGIDPVMERERNNFYNWRSRGRLDLNVLNEEMRRNTE